MSLDFTGPPKLMKLLSTKVILDMLPSFVRRSSAFVKAFRSDTGHETIRFLSRRHLDRDDQRHIQQYSSLAKISGSNVAVEVAFEALQIAGLESSLHRFELEKIYRDAKLTQIYEGTNQLNLHNLFIHSFPGVSRYAE